MNYQDSTKHSSSQTSNLHTTSNIIAFPVKKGSIKNTGIKSVTAQQAQVNQSQSRTASSSFAALVIISIAVIFALMTLFVTIGMVFCRSVAASWNSLARLWK